MEQHRQAVRRVMKLPVRSQIEQRRNDCRHHPAGAEEPESPEPFQRHGAADGGEHGQRNDLPRLGHRRVDPQLDCEQHDDNRAEHRGGLRPERPAAATLRADPAGQRRREENEKQQRIREMETVAVRIDEDAQARRLQPIAGA